MLEVIGIFLMACIITLFAGPRIARVSEELAERTGIGQALFGAIFLAASTSLPGLVTTASAALASNPSLAISNGIGGIAAQTAFLAIADLTYKRANLEHAGASAANLFFVILLVVLLATTLIASFSRELSLFHVSPFSLAMVSIYLTGMRLSYWVEKRPMWTPVATDLMPKKAEDAESEKSSLSRLILTFIIFAILLFFAGFSLSYAGDRATGLFGLSPSLVGAALTGSITSLPELVTTITATRRGALVLAISNIVGGNAFDSLFVAVGDALYFEGSIFARMVIQDQLLIAASIILTGILGLGLIVRERHGWQGIGFESVAILVIYFLTLWLVAVQT